VYAITSVGLFCSTLWPCIFTLAVSGLGKHTSQGSSFLIMMIMGGGIVSWLQGSSFRSYRYPKQLYCRRFMFCLFGFMLGRSVVFLKNQGVNLDSKVAGGH
jgi:FHS family L-fucose permease-like MFS transporter